MEHRQYERVSINAKGVFFLDDKNILNREFSGILNNISENGFKVTIDATKYPQLLKLDKNNDIFDFYIIDEYDLFEQHKKAIMDGRAKIIRRCFENKALIIGCELITPRKNLLDYVSDKKTIAFVASL